MAGHFVEPLLLQFFTEDGEKRKFAKNYVAIFSSVNLFDKKLIKIITKMLIY